MYVVMLIFCFSILIQQQEVAIPPESIDISGIPISYDQSMQYSCCSPFKSCDISLYSLWSQIVWPGHVFLTHHCVPKVAKNCKKKPIETRRGVIPG